MTFIHFKLNLQRNKVCKKWRGVNSFWSHCTCGEIENEIPDLCVCCAHTYISSVSVCVNGRPRVRGSRSKCTGGLSDSFPWTCLSAGRGDQVERRPVPTSDQRPPEQGSPADAPPAEDQRPPEKHRDRPADPGQRQLLHQHVALLRPSRGQASPPIHSLSHTNCENQ